MQAIGLKTHIWNNAAKTVLLLLGFPFLLLLIAFGFNLVFVAMFEDDPDIIAGIGQAVEMLPHSMVVALAGAVIWLVIAFFFHQTIIDGLTGAKEVDRKTDPRLYNFVENLAISRGMSIPAVRIIETPALNAYASGVRREHYAVTVTRGLLDTLNDAELEAVLAHEMTHIRNGDVRLIVVAAVFAGIISLTGDLLLRGFFRGGLRYRPTYRNSGNRSSSPGKGGGGGGAIVLILIAVAIFILARLTAVALRMAISRSREYMADAGAVEMTKDPDAMISALRKIENRSSLGSIPGQVEALFIDSDSSGLWATHPSIGERCAALVRYAGGRDSGPLPLSTIEKSFEQQEQDQLRNAKDVETGAERFERESRPPLPDAPRGPWT